MFQIYLNSSLFRVHFLAGTSQKLNSSSRFWYRLTMPNFTEIRSVDRHDLSSTYSFYAFCL